MIDSQSITRELDRIIEREGGYSNHDADLGRATKHGITQATLEAWLRMKMGDKFKPPADVRLLDEDMARTIYRELYIHRPGFDNITDPRLFSLVVDSGVQHGTERATEWLQQALGVTADGVFGPVTRGALEKQAYSVYPATGGLSALYKRILATRLRFYSEIIHNDHTQAAFAVGWTNRMIPFIDVMELP